MILKNIIGFRTKYRMHLMLSRFRASKGFSSVVLDDMRPKCFIFLAADYGNLGDVAITWAQTQFIERQSRFQVVEIPISKSIEGIWWVKANIKKDDVVTIVGGGNMGDLYDQIEYIRQLVIRFFPDNKIISFPQTIDFSDTPGGRRLLRIAQRVYNRHTQLYLLAREQSSYQAMQGYFPNCSTHICPDIVLSSLLSLEECNRSGLVFCMRNDDEKSLSAIEEKIIRDQACRHFTHVSEYDTHIGRSGLSVKEREAELFKIWNTFKAAELVITDRLHGMIFCYITNTPCVVFQNSNHKVRETFAWLPQESTITLMEQFDELRFRDYLSERAFKREVQNQHLGGMYQELASLFN